MRFSHLNRCALAKPARLNGTCEIFHFILSPTVALLHTTSDMTEEIHDHAALIVLIILIAIMMMFVTLTILIDNVCKLSR